MIILHQNKQTQNYRNRTDLTGNAEKIFAFDKSEVSRAYLTR